MISDLPFGERMSLKGKLFELQKKLQLIDLEQKLGEECTYKPHIGHYDLPNRQHDVLDSINKAELIRKQRKELLARSANQQAEEQCTFSPTIFTKSRSGRFHSSFDDSRPVFQRLVEKGKEYREQHKRRTEFYNTIDQNDGSRLFTPRIPEYNPKGATVTSFHQASADEFLYQDAKDREIRLQQLAAEHERQLAMTASASKMNNISLGLLQQRAEKQARRLFLYIDANKDGRISYEDAVLFFQHCTTLHSCTEERRVHLLKIFWSVADYQQEGELQLNNFCVLVKAFLLYRSVPQVVAYLQEQDRRPDSVANQMGQEAPHGEPVMYEDHAGDHDEAHYNKTRHFAPAAFSSSSSSLPPPPPPPPPPGSTNSWASLTKLRKNDVDEFLTLVNDLIKEASEAHSAARMHDSRPTGSLPVAAASSRAAHTATDTASNHVAGTGAGSSDETPLFKPHINPRSYKLAERKEQKEQAIVSEELSVDALETSTLAASSVNTRKSAHDRLLARAELAKKQKQERAEELRRQELEQCTFKPTLKAVYRKNSAAATHASGGGNASSAAAGHDPSASAQLNSSQELDNPADSSLPVDDPPNDQEDDLEGQPSPSSPRTHPALHHEQGSPSHHETALPVHQRLYNYRRKLPTDGSSGPPTYMQELQTCTFAPKIRPVPACIKAPAPVIAGYDRNVRRQREVLKTKQLQKDMDEHAFEASQASYIRSRELAARGPEPFKLATEERIQRMKEMSQQSAPPPSLIIDVKLGGAKNARIRVVEGDDPVELAQCFGKIYGLDAAAVQVLATVVRKSMTRGGIQHRPGGGDKALHGHHGVNGNYALDMDAHEMMYGEQEEYSSYTISDQTMSEDSQADEDEDDDDNDEDEEEEEEGEDDEQEDEEDEARARGEMDEGEDEEPRYSDEEDAGAGRREAVGSRETGKAAIASRDEGAGHKSSKKPKEKKKRKKREGLRGSLLSQLL